MDQRADVSSGGGVVDVSHVGKRHRRPTGAPPPLPKSIGATGVFRLALVVLVVIPGCIWLRVNPEPLDRFDAAITDAVVSLRSGWLDTLARAVYAAGTRYGLAVIALATIGCTAWFRRWRHLTVFVLGVAIVELLVAGLTILAARPRPFSVTAIASWEGFSMPSPSMAGLAVMVTGIVYMLVVPGRPRMWAKWVCATVLIAAGLLRIYLGIEYLTDALFGAILGISIPVAMFRAWAPNDVYPVSYGVRGKAAHLDVSGKRGEAIRVAMKDQLGFDVIDMKPVGLEGSGGSTPLKLQVIDEQGATRSVFAKLYARTHVRADRWYKLGRTMLYGRLEDETPFGTVRRFVEYEDYTLRLLGEYGFPTPAPLGIVEITPEREYLIAMEFFEDAVEIGQAEIDEQVIDDGLRMIRQMWDIGLAHRDIKPANLMVQDGRLRLIDVFFVQVRPSPWRQAVDLGNMMLVLALRADAQTVYERALEYFTPEELSEAFAATKGVASPSQLRQSMKQDGRGLLETFRGLVPPRKPIAIQRWSVRRVLLIVVTLLLLVAAVSTGISLFFPSTGDVVIGANCGTGRTMQLMAQAVPTATRVPCTTTLPLGWGFSSARVGDGEASFELQLGGGASALVMVTLTETCPAVTEGAGLEVIPIEGGCVEYQVPPGVAPSDVPSFQPNGGLSFTARSDLVAFVRDQVDLTLCGADAPPC